MRTALALTITLLLAFPLALQFKLLAIGHCLLAAAGASALARRIGCGGAAAAASGIAYALAWITLAVKAGLLVALVAVLVLDRPPASRGLARASAAGPAP